MLTKSDLFKIKELLDNYSTKTDFKELREDIVKFKDEILDEIRDLREEVTVVTGYKDTIEDHENRIVSLEEKTDLQQH